jgi:hypothetical protein
MFSFYLQTQKRCCSLRLVTNHIFNLRTCYRITSPNLFKQQLKFVWFKMWSLFFYPCKENVSSFLYRWFSDASFQVKSAKGLSKHEIRKSLLTCSKELLLNQNVSLCYELIFYIRAPRTSIYNAEHQEIVYLKVFLSNTQSLPAARGTWMMIVSFHFNSNRLLVDHSTIGQ